MSRNISRFIAVLVFLSGILNITSALFSRIPPRVYLIEDLFPISVIHFSRTLVIISGVFLLFLAQGIWLRKERSWWLSIITIGSSIILHLIKRLDLAESLILFLILALLIIFRKLFTIKSSRFGFVKGIRISLVILALLFIYAFFGYYALQGQLSSPVNANNIIRDYMFSVFGVGRDTFIPLTRHAVWFENSISTVGLISIWFIYAALFAPLVDKRKPSDEDLELAKKILDENGSNSLDYLNLAPGKNFFFSNDRTGFLSYRVAYDTAIVLGDPEGRNLKSTVIEFTEDCEARGLNFAFYGTSKAHSSIYIDQGLKLLKIGEEAVIDTSEFDQNTPELKDIRYGMNRIVKNNCSMRWFPMDQITWKVISDTDKLYKEWLSAKNTPPLNFSLGFYPFPLLEKSEVLAVYSESEELLVLLSFLPYQSGHGMTLDLMMKSPSAVNGIIEGAIGNAVIHFREKGVREINLGMVPVQGQGGKKKPADRAIEYIFNFIVKFSGYENLRKFKENFAPEWQDKYLVYKNTADLPRISLAVARVHLPEKIRIKLPKFKTRNKKNRN